MKKMFIIFILFVLVGCSTVSYNHTPLFSSGSLKVLLASDIHHFDSSLFVEGELLDRVLLAGDGKMLNRSDDLLEAFVSNVIKEEADVLLVTGDLTLNGERMSHLSLAEGFRLIEAAGTRVFVVPGNHDVNNPRSRGYGEFDPYQVDNISVKEFASIYAEFGLDGSESLKDPNSLSYLVKLSESQWVFMLDSNNNTKKGKFATDISGSIGDDTLLWMEELMVDSDVNVMVGMHHNLYTHSEAVNEGFTIDNNSSLLSFFEKFDVSLVFSGHIHIQSIIDREIVEIVSSSLSVSPNQYGVLEINNDGFDYYTKQVEFGLDDFVKDSEDYFLEVARYKVLNRLKDSDLEIEDRELLADLFSELNQYYFAGEVVEDVDSYRSSRAYELIDELGFFKQYLKDILDNKVDSNRLSK